MKLRRIEIPFENPMNPTQTILAWMYLLVHVAVLPWLLGLYRRYSPDPISDLTLNLVYYGVGIVFCLTVTFSLLRGGFDVLAENLRRCILTMLMAFFLDYVLSGVAALALSLLEGAVANPNNEEVLSLAQAEPGGVRALTIFLVPIVEEVLFRGAVFGSIRPRSRFWAFAVSTAAFAVYHVWAFALDDASLWIYVLQYVPISVALAWAYERSGTIWTPIFFHMGINAMGFYLADALQL